MSSDALGDVVLALGGNEFIKLLNLFLFVDFEDLGAIEFHPLKNKFLLIVS